MGFNYLVHSLQIVSVTAESSADSCGVYPGCTLTHINGHPATHNKIASLSYPSLVTFVYPVSVPKCFDLRLGVRATG